MRVPEHVQVLSFRFRTSFRDTDFNPPLARSEFVQAVRPQRLDAAQDEIRPDGFREVRVEEHPLLRAQLESRQEVREREDGRFAFGQSAVLQLVQEGAPLQARVVHRVQSERHRRVTRVQRRRPYTQPEIAHHSLRGRHDFDRGRNVGLVIERRVVPGEHGDDPNAAGSGFGFGFGHVDVVDVDVVAVVPVVVPVARQKQKRLGAHAARLAQRQHGFQFSERVAERRCFVPSLLFAFLFAFAFDPQVVVPGREEDVAELALEQPEGGLQDPQVVGHVAAQDDGVARERDVAQGGAPRHVLRKVGVDVAHHEHARGGRDTRVVRHRDARRRGGARGGIAGGDARHVGHAAETARIAMARSGFDRARSRGRRAHDTAKARPSARLPERLEARSRSIERDAGGGTADLGRVTGGT
eukprot:CAMPEP_0203004200 /NCGR_PEP_ID=MMETSP1401-20130829/2267_2 /ASSEMBLY_ACC=CAM_ASM_000894 /TAXON_ID=38833 /ORGANISM="Micromonas pusilla, Strain CCAC1681" /LENGTH=411 /DNA_ID=CAMNT_0049745805 /DNA_START=394 /DNA_END=1626 /DNA_ORIENTATION=-